MFSELSGGSLLLLERLGGRQLAQRGRLPQAECQRKVGRHLLMSDVRLRVWLE